MLGDLNGWIGDRVRASITGAFGVPRENANGRRVIEFCAERKLCVSNILCEQVFALSTQGWQGAKMGES